ncbi:hypothetical protein TNCV_3386341 [Trichonephila clavipes]|nr:hypothetical protein TNCV_3386341 [Trichonephila clavipes]
MKVARVVLYDSWQHHLSPPPQIMHGAGGEENILQSPSPMASAAMAHKTLGPTDLTSTYIMHTNPLYLFRYTKFIYNFRNLCFADKFS